MLLATLLLFVPQSLSAGENSAAEAILKPPVVLPKAEIPPRGVSKTWRNWSS